MELAAYICLLLSFFSAAFSLPAGRVLLAVSLVLLIRHLWRERQRPYFPATAWLCMAFVMVAVVVTLFLGVDPELGISKLGKLLWWVALPMAAALVTTPARLSALLGAYAVGTGVLALKMFVRNPIQAVMSLRGGESADFMSGIIHVASMADAQRLVIGLIATLGMICIMRGKSSKSAFWWVLLGLQCVALIMTFKRGSLLCAIIVVGLFILLRMNWRYIFVLIGIVAIVLCLPPVRVRIAAMKSELQSGGGRITMWTKIAPALIEKHPWGVGFRSLTNEMMREIAPDVERDRNHLHSNLLEVLVETGWLGFAVYVLWMSGSLFDAWGFAWRARSGAIEDAIGGIALFLMLVGLLANGLVEYNFGDSELVIPCALIIGAAAAGRLRHVSKVPKQPN